MLSPQSLLRAILMLQQLLLGVFGLGAARAEPPPIWEMFASVDAVTGCNAGKPTGYDNATCFHIGVSGDAQGCEKLVAQLLASGGPAINIFTWHDKTQGSRFANHCIGRTDNVWSPHGPGPGHTTGCNSAAVSCKNHPPIGPSGPSKVPLAFECGMREAAYHFGQHLAPARGTFVELFDAMQLESMCNKTRPKSTAACSRAGWVAAAAAAAQRSAGRKDSSETAKEFHVNSASGSDTNPGTSASPFASVERGVQACRGATTASSPGSCTVLVHAPGTYYLKQTLQLGAADSGLTIQGLPTATGEMPATTSV
jgi:hypothetical protein